jgi:regulator of cell morphogenesis and NO signaling
MRSWDNGAVEDAGVDGARSQPLRDVLERDHREVDSAVERYADGSASGADARPALQQAVDDLRRHIYVEEELLFPSLRAAGMLGPIMVMLREHGQMWPVLDELDQQLHDDAGDDVLGTACRGLLDLLQSHNPKEEQILYPQVDGVLGPDATLRVHEFLEAGRLPAGWQCQHLARARGDA